MKKSPVKYRNPVELREEMNNKARALDKMHVERMVKAMTGVLVSFAFEDDQACRAAAYLVAKCARAKPLAKDAVLDLVSRAIDAEAKDRQPAEESRIVQ